MKIIYGVNRIKKFKKPVVALGVFDGVHRGHRVILRSAVDKARRIKGTSIALTFWPHPQKQGSLYSLEHRLNLINELGIDVCIIVRFSKTFSKISAENFVKNILVKNIRASYIYIGENFRFGKGAKGNTALLGELAKQYNYKIKVFKVVKINNKAISSTYIRNLIRRGKIIEASKLLLRPVSILGTVIRGTSFAKGLGFPTANIDPHHEVIPPDGVYAVGVIFGKNNYRGACYIGPKPHFLKQRHEKNIEVHIFNFHKNIYGKTLEVQFLKKIRKAKRFNSISVLAAQIKTDILAINPHH